MTLLMRLSRTALAMCPGVLPAASLKLRCDFSRLARTPFSSIPLLAEMEWKYPTTDIDSSTVALPPPAKSVPDPFQWLEGDVRTVEKVSQWVQQQHDVGEKVLSQFEKNRNEFSEEISDVLNSRRTYPSALRGTRWFLKYNEGLQDFFVHYYTDVMQPEEFAKIEDPASAPGLVKLVDPNELSDDKSISLGYLGYSRDGQMVAYTTSKSGSDWKTLYFMEFRNGHFEPLSKETVEWVRDTPTILHDRSGYFLVVCDPPESDASTYSQLVKNRRVIFKSFGDEEPKEIWRDAENPSKLISTYLDHSGRWLIMQQYSGASERARIFLRDNWHPSRPVITVYDDFNNNRSVVGVRGTRLLVRTDSEDAKNKKIVYREIQEDGQSIAKEERILIPEDKQYPLHDATLFRDGTLQLSYMKDVIVHIAFHSSLSGTKFADFDSPSGIGDVAIYSDIVDGNVYYSFASFAEQLTIYRFNVWSGKHQVVFRQASKLEPGSIETQQVFAQNGNVKVPAFIVMRQGQELNGNAPTILYGYGGFQISLTPAFISWLPSWLKRGGIFVMANIRGGTEYGEEWHSGGMRENKQNCFNDFIAVAEYLIQNKYTSPAHLGISGGSNGGLLVGACITQRPELFGAAVPQVGVLDMLRFHKFTSGVHWVDEYGNPDEEKDFDFLLEYSPYHKVLRDGPKAYPPTLVMTADTDDRVVPGHSFKFLAALQQMQTNSTAPVVSRLEIKAGHGAGLALTKMITSSADKLAFFSGFL